MLNPMRFAQRRAQADFGVRHQDQVNMIVHQAPSQASGAVGKTGSSQQRQTGLSVVITEGHRQSPVVPQLNMMRHVGNHDAGKTGYNPPIASGVKEVN